MAIRTGTSNPALGLPSFGVAFDAPTTVPLGTVTQGFDDVANKNNEYIWLQSPANIIVGDEVTYDNNHLATEVAAPAGQAVAVAVSNAGQFAWFRLKRRGVIA